MASEVTICNSALVKIGGDTISSLTEETREAILCKTLYDSVRDSLLRSHYWNFALKRVELSASATTPEFGWDYQYQLPSDCLRVVAINQSNTNYAIEGRKVLTNTSTLKIVYVFRETSVNNYDVTFLEALAYKLAAQLAYPLAKSLTLAQAMETKANIELKDCRSFDGQEGGIQKLGPNSWLDSRICGADIDEQI